MHVKAAVRNVLLQGSLITNSHYIQGVP